MFGSYLASSHKIDVAGVRKWPRENASLALTYDNGLGSPPTINYKV